MLEMQESQREERGIWYKETDLDGINLQIEKQKAFGCNKSNFFPFLSTTATESIQTIRIYPAAQPQAIPYPSLMFAPQKVSESKTLNTYASSASDFRQAVGNIDISQELPPGHTPPMT